jgi:hypothetical protein
MGGVEQQRKCAIGWCMFIIRVSSMIINNPDRFEDIKGDEQVDISGSDLDEITNEFLQKERPHLGLREYLSQMHEVEAKFEEGPHMLDVFFARHERLLTDPSVRLSFENFPFLRNLLSEKSLHQLNYS